MPIFVKSLVGAKLVEARELALGAISRLRQSGELPPKDEEFVVVEKSDAQIPVVPQPAPEPETIRVLVTQPGLGYMISVPVPSELTVSVAKPWLLENKNNLWDEAILLKVARSEHTAECTFLDSKCGYITVTGDVVRNA